MSKICQRDALKILDDQLNKERILSFSKDGAIVDLIITDKDDKILAKIAATSIADLFETLEGSMFS